MKEAAKSIKPADGKLAVLLPGMGAVGTTFMAGAMMARKNLGHPVGSLTQLGSIRLGKRTDKKNPRIQDFVPLAKLPDLVFGGWDIFEDNAYEVGEARRRHEERAPRPDQGRAEPPSSR